MHLKIQIIFEIRQVMKKCKQTVIMYAAPKAPSVPQSVNQWVDFYILNLNIKIYRKVGLTAVKMLG